MTPEEEFAIAKLRAALRGRVRARPETIWSEYERETGPLEEIDLASIREVLEAQSFDAAILGQTTLKVPRIVVEKMLADWKARLAGRSTRAGGRPRKSWGNQRWEQTAVEQFENRRADLMDAGLTNAHASKRAAVEIAKGYYVEPPTIRDWARAARRRQHSTK